MAKVAAQDSAPEKTITEVILKFLEGENEGVEIRVSPPRELSVGRSEECDIFLGEKKVSRNHCQIIVNPNEVRLKDFGSTNGTYLNSKKVSGEVVLQDEDKIKVGTSVAQLSIAMATLEAQPQPLEAEIGEESGTTIEPATAATVAGQSHADLMDEELSGVMEPPSDEVEEDDAEDSLGSDFGPLEAAPSATPKPSISEAKAKPLSGNLSAMGLADLLQNLAQNRKSGMLELSGPREGKIWVREGSVIGAQSMPVSGQKALFRMLAWNEGEFEFNALPSSFRADEAGEQIDSTVETLLMEGFRQFDEIEKIRKGLPKKSAPLKLKHKLTAPLSKLHPRVLDVLQSVLNEGTLERAMDVSALSDLDTAKIVLYLLKKDYIVAE